MPRVAGIGRGRVLVLIMALLIPALVPTLAGAPTQAENQVSAPLDLAAMTLGPVDLAQAGLPGFGWDWGTVVLPADIVALLVERDGLSEQAARDQVTQVGFRRWYESYLYLPVDPGEPFGAIAQTVSSYVIEFDNPAGATAGWALLEDESGDPEIVDVPLNQAFGDQAEGTRYSGDDPATGERFQALDLSVRLGKLHVGVRVVDSAGMEPDLATGEMLTARLLERVTATRASGGPGLSNQVVRLAGGGVQTSYDGYDLLAGEPILYLGEAPESAAERGATQRDAGVVDRYRMDQLVAPGAHPDDDVWYFLRLIRFSDATAAAARLAATPDRIAADAGLANLQIDPSAPALGDESIAYTVEEVATGVTYRSVALRVGASVAIIDVFGPEPPPAAAVHEIAAAQATCLAAGSCLEPHAVPLRLTSYIAALRAVGKLTQAPVVTPPAATPPPATGQTGMYESPGYGYTLTYDPTVWTLAPDDDGNPDDGDGEEWITLDSEGSRVNIAGRPGAVAGDLTTCVESYLVEYGWDDGAYDATPIEPLRVEPDRAVGTYTLLDQVFGDSTAYMSVDCRDIGGGSTLLITHFVYTDEREPVPEAEVAAFDQLMSGLVVDTQTGIRSLDVTLSART